MIEQARRLCRQDARFIAGLVGGSFASGEGDAFSDVDFVFFLSDEDLPGFDQRAWVSQLAPVELYFADDFGHYTAIFGNLLRAEYHFEPISAVAQVESWQGSAYFPSLADCLLVDKSGELTSRLAPLLVPPSDRGGAGRAAALQANFANTILLGVSVLARGEAARALEVLSMVHRYLLFMARLVEGRTNHWPTPSRRLEQDLSPAAYARYAACSAPLDPAALWTAYRSSWQWGRELASALAARYGAGLPATLVTKLDARLIEIAV